MTISHIGSRQASYPALCGTAQAQVRARNGLETLEANGRCCDMASSYSTMAGGLVVIEAGSWELASWCGACHWVRLGGVVMGWGARVGV